MRSMFLAVGLVVGVPSLAWAGPKAPAPAVQPAPQGKLVFAVQTGPEDPSGVGGAIKHAKAALGSGYLSDVVLVFYGRAAMLFDAGNGAFSDDLRVKLAEARAAGVRVQVCAKSLERFGADPVKAAEQAEVVPGAILEISRYIAEGYEVMSY